jgi:hypothetical protein
VGTPTDESVMTLMMMSDDESDDSLLLEIRCATFFTRPFLIEA